MRKVFNSKGAGGLLMNRVYIRVLSDQTGIAFGCWTEGLVKERSNFEEVGISFVACQEEVAFSFQGDYLCLFCLYILYIIFITY